VSPGDRPSLSFSWALAIFSLIRGQPAALYGVFSFLELQPFLEGFSLTSFPSQPSFRLFLFPLLRLIVSGLCSAWHACLAPLAALWLPSHPLFFFFLFQIAVFSFLFFSASQHAENASRSPTARRISRRRGPALPCSSPLVGPPLESFRYPPRHTKAGSCIV